MIAPIHNMLALINPAALPALRIAATFFFLIYLLGGTYIFRNRHRFFDQDSNVDNDIPAVRNVEDRGRHDPLARFDHASPDSADLSLARLTSAVVCSPELILPSPR